MKPQLPPPRWTACEAPERIPDEHMAWHWAPCLGCAVKAQMEWRRQGDWEQTHIGKRTQLLMILANNGIEP